MDRTNDGVSASVASAVATAGPRALSQPTVVIVLPAYNAARTLERTYADIPHELVHRIILVDDVSRDETVDIARQLGLDVIIHSQNRGYGGNQKTCYDAALAAGADIVIMLHPDYQYDATRIPALIAPIADGSREAPFKVLCRLQQKGLIRHIGVSNFTPTQIAEARRIGPIVCVQRPRTPLRRCAH